MTDNITVNRELLNGKCLVDISLLRQVLVRLELGGPEWERDNMIKALRAALEQPAPSQEPVAEVVWSKDTNYEFKFKMLVELACREGVPVKLYAGSFESGGMYWHDTTTDKPAAPQPAPEAKPEKINPLTQLQVAYVMGLRDAQPRKDVKLTHLSLGALDEIYRESFGLIDSRLVGDQITFARAIEQAVLKANGVSNENA